MKPKRIGVKEIEHPMTDSIEPPSRGFDVQEGEQKVLQDHYSLIKHLTSVNIDKIKKDIGMDFKLARFSDKDKAFVNEMVTNAYFIKDVILRCLNVSPNYDYVGGKFVKKPVSKQVREKVKKIAEECFHAPLIKLHMLAILSQNVKGNPLLRMILSQPESEEERLMAQEEQNKKFTEKIKELVRPEVPPK